MRCARAVYEGVLPPTINYRTSDPDCDLDDVPNEARTAQVEVALSNAMGLGGHNACVLVGRARVRFASPRVWTTDSVPSIPVAGLPARILPKRVVSKSSVSSLAASAAS